MPQPRDTGEKQDEGAASLRAQGALDFILLPNRGGQVMATYQGECFCGTVKIEASGEPEGMGYCHCQSCRSWSAGPVNAFTLWKPSAVRIAAGAEHVATFQKTQLSQRQY